MYGGAWGCGNQVINTNHAYAIGCNITTVSYCTTHLNCLNLNLIACCNYTDGQLLPVGTVYFDTDCNSLNISL